MRRLLFLAVVALAFAPAAAAQPFLSLDTTWIRSTSAQRVVNHPQKWVDNPITAPGNISPYLSVIHDGSGYRLWYDAAPAGDSSYHAVGYETSGDGLHFSAPTFLTNPAANDFSWGPSVLGGQMMAWTSRDGMYLSTSTDGVSWTDRGLVLGANTDNVTIYRLGAGYAAIVKTTTSEFSVPRRVLDISTSPDGLTWSPLQPLFDATGPDGVEELYGMGGIVRRGNLWVGLLRVLRNDVEDGIGYTVLAWSHEGINWQRDEAPFLDRTPGAGFDHAMAWADARLAEKRTTIYYGGYAYGHKDDPYTSRTLGVAAIKQDRYVSYQGGSLTTKRLWLENLRLNMRGVVRFRVGSVSCVARGDGVSVRPKCDKRLPSTGVISFDLRAGQLFALSSF